MFTIKYTDITDGVLALASLRGDITGRGDELVDNDDFALTEILRTLVPALLYENKVVFHATRCGWRIGPTHLHKSELTAFLRLRLLAFIAGKEPDESTVLRADPLSRRVVDIRPHDI